MFTGKYPRDAFVPVKVASCLDDLFTSLNPVLCLAALVSPANLLFRAAVKKLTVIYV